MFFFLPSAIEQLDTAVLAKASRILPTGRHCNTSCALKMKIGGLLPFPQKPADLGFGWIVQRILVEEHEIGDHHREQ
jgi:hypothetical protein